MILLSLFFMDKHPEKRFQKRWNFSPSSLKAQRTTSQSRRGVTLMRVSLSPAALPRLRAASYTCSGQSPRCLDGIFSWKAPFYVRFLTARACAPGGETAPCAMSRGHRTDCRAASSRGRARTGSDRSGPADALSRVLTCVTQAQDEYEYMRSSHLIHGKPLSQSDSRQEQQLGESYRSSRPPSRVTEPRGSRRNRTLSIFKTKRSGNKCGENGSS